MSTGITDPGGSSESRSNFDKGHSIHFPIASESRGGFLCLGFLRLVLGGIGACDGFTVAHALPRDGAYLLFLIESGSSAF